MLRYVSRRIKDTVERTSNVLEARRTWTFNSNEGVGSYDGHQSSYEQNKNQRFQRHLDGRSANSIFEFGLEPKVPDSNFLRKNCRENLWHFQQKPATSDSGSSSSDKEDGRERIHHKNHCKIQKSFIDALTWSSALICGWYTSQILCMRRRHLQNGWSGHCRYANILMQPSQAFHSSILSHWAQATPVKPNDDAFVWDFREDSQKFHSRNEFYKEKLVEPITNDHLKSADENSTKKAKESAPKTFDDAAHNLLHILGDIEFQLGVASVQSDRYDLAVSHFKLAASHSHASAAYNLGVCYEEGIGIGKNLKMAFECYMLASSMGHAKALYNVGVYHARGLADLPKNRKAARQYFKEAAKLGLNEANKALGVPSIAPVERVEPIMIGTNVAADYKHQPVVVVV